MLATVEVELDEKTKLELLKKQAIEYLKLNPNKRFRIMQILLAIEGLSANNIQIIRQKLMEETYKEVSHIIFSDTEEHFVMS